MDSHMVRALAPKSSRNAGVTIPVEFSHSMQQHRSQHQQVPSSSSIPYLDLDVLAVSMYYSM
jgi:hypothetical protein